MGTGPRPEEPEKALTAEMFVPIFPNVDHPAGREPIRTKAPFPFPNCSQWAEMSVKVRAKKGSYPGRLDEGAIGLRATEYLRMSEYLVGDGNRARAAVEAQEDAAADPGSPSPADDEDSEESDEYSVHSLDGVVSMDPFGINDPEEGEEWLPVVDVWNNMAEQITAEEIANPMDFYKERDALIACVFSPIVSALVV